MSSDRCQNDHTIMDYLFVGPAGLAGRPIFVETPAGYYVKFHFLLFFDQKNWVVGWCFPTHEIKMFKIQKNTFQMLLISSHLDIVSRFSAQMKFEQLSGILYFFCISFVFVLYCFCIAFRVAKHEPQNGEGPYPPQRNPYPITHDIHQRMICEDQDRSLSSSSQF